MDLAVATYSLSRFLRVARHGELASQLLRAVISVPLNIAEGKGRGAPRQFAQFLRTALASLREVETIVELLDRLRLAKKETIAELVRLADETGRALYGLEQSVLKDVRDPHRRSRQPMPTSEGRSASSRGDRY
jgi:four helix bundle protein